MPFRLLVLQHSPLDHPGVMRRYLAEDGVHWDAVDMHDGDEIPPLDDYDALLVMGGPQQTDQEAEFPWLAVEKRYIRDAVEAAQKPVLGICLGAQLIAETMGGRVGAMSRPEIGVLDVEFTDGAAGDALFAGLATPAKTLQWHLYAVLDLPPGASHLMRSAACENQAFRIGDLAYGVQYHMELDAEMVLGTEAFPEYVVALEAQQGVGALQRLAAETERHAVDLDRSARLIYDNFLALA
jgi:GMP synthase-like glutamine amidotransferase